jgi:hypothetical protein
MIALPTVVDGPRMLLMRLLHVFAYAALATLHVSLSSCSTTNDRRVQPADITDLPTPLRDAAECTVSVMRNSSRVESIRLHAVRSDEMGAYPVIEFLYPDVRGQRQAWVFSFNPEPASDGAYLYDGWPILVMVVLEPSAVTFETIRARCNAEAILVTQ